MSKDNIAHTHTAAQHFPDHRKGDAEVVFHREIGGQKTVDEGFVPSSPAHTVQHYIGHDGMPTSVLERNGKTDVHRGFDQPGKWPVDDPARIKWELTLEAEQLASSSDWRQAGDRFTAMTAQWKSVQADRSTESVLGDRFFGAKKQFFAARHRHFEERDRQRAVAKDAKERLILEAKALVGREDKGAADRMRTIMNEWKNAGHAGREDEDRLWAQFKSAREDFFARRKAREDDAKRVKERIVSEAARLATSTDWKATGDRFRTLMEEWKKAGRAGREDEDRLWSAFDRHRKQFHDSRQRYFDERDRQAKAALAKKQGIVARAQAAARSADTRVAGDQMRSLLEEWKTVGRAGREDEDRLWGQFRAAQDALRSRKQHQYEQRQREQSAAKATKQAIVSRAQSLVTGPDFRASKDRMRALRDEWKSAGRASKEDEERLWSQLEAARTLLNQNAQNAYEQGKRERAQRLRENIDRKRQSLARVESSIWEAEQRYSEMLSRPDPSWNNPRRWEITSKRNASRSNLESKIASMKSRRADLITQITDMESKWRSML